MSRVEIHEAILETICTLIIAGMIQFIVLRVLLYDLVGLFFLGGVEVGPHLAALKVYSWFYT